MKRFSTEFRAAEFDGGRLIGYASVFGQVARIGNGFEQIDPGAFNRALSEGHDVALLVNHDGLPLARTSSGTLRLSVDENGLVPDADLPDTQLGRDVRVLMERGDLTKMSFAFTPTAEEWRDVEGVKVRTITDLDLYDVSLVTFPAYDGTTAELRARQVLSTNPRARRASGQAALIRAKFHIGGTP